MTQRRTPSGQGPTRRPGAAGRLGAGRAGTGRLGTGRAGTGRGGTARSGATFAGRDFPARAEARRTPVSARSTESSRSASRPAAARRTNPGGGAAKRTAAPSPRKLTGRATVLLVILTVLALAYTYPVRVYLDQKSDITRIQDAQADQRERIDDLREEVAKWQDDEYIKIQVKRRFYFVQPGETPLIPVWDGEPGATTTGSPAGAGAEPAQPWYDTLWSSIQAADQEPRQ